jgi:1-acyl-sn-glycerol-3-phosphate acyltransferase
MVTVPQDASRLWRSLHRLITVIKPLFCQLTVEGATHLPPTGGCIIACNHTLGPDYIVLGYASPRQIHYMAKREIFGWHPLLTKLFVAAGAFPVDRGKGDRVALQTAVERVRGGAVLGMFPEGTRSRTGHLMRGKTGVARIAMMAQAPVVPAVVINAGAILPQLLRPVRRPEVIVRFGPPLCPTGDPDDPTLTRANTDMIMQALAALLPAERRGEYAASGS